MRKLVVSALALMIIGGAVTASAAPIVFTTSGTAGGQPVSGKATFNFSATTFTITLENLTSPTSFTSQELDGLTFRLSPSGSPTLTGVSPAAIVDCSGDHSVPCAPYAGVVPVNDGWGVTTSAGLSNLTTTPLGFHPYAIINSNYTLPGAGNGNLANGSHNPFLIGPVIFTFAGTFTDVSDVTFFWGTNPDTTRGTDLTHAPEPGSLLLLGTGLGYVVRKVRKRQATA